MMGSGCRIRLRVVLCFLASVLASWPAAAEMFTVGQDFSCTHTSIQDALFSALVNGPGYDLIVVTEEMSYTDQALDVWEQSVELMGGYSCEYPEMWNPVTISGNGTQPVIRIQTTQGYRDTVTLRNLYLTNGGGTRGGGLRVEGAAYAALAGTTVSGNTAQEGGGISATRLGGTGQGGVVRLLAGSEVSGNQALTGDGGGIYVGVNGQLHIFPDHVLISSNTAAASGGGIAVAGGTATVGTVDLPVVIDDATGAVVSGNHAGIGGGGVYLFTGSLDARELAIENNSADFQGGGLLAYSGATFDLRRDYPGAYRVQCPARTHCSRISGNTAPGNTNGVGVALFLGSHGAIRQTEISGHTVGTGSVALLDTSTLDLENTLVTGNSLRSTATGVGFVVRLANASPPNSPRLRIAFSTLAANMTFEEGSGQLLPASDVLAPQNTSMKFYSSALLDSPYAATSYPSTLGHSADCVIKLYGGGFSPEVVVTRSANIYLPDAGFVGAGDYRPVTASPLVDFCDQSAWSPQTRDLDLKPRCYDQPANANDHGSCDVGAYERALAWDGIFMDGFGEP